jgi:hypothetical protein
MQATWSQPVTEVVVFSNDLARRRDRPRRPWATSTRQACRMGRKTGCLSSHPDPADLKAVVSADGARSRRRDTAVHQDKLEPVDDALTGQVFQHELAGPVLVGRGGYNQRGHEKAGDVDCDDALGTLGAAVGPSPVVEGEPTVRGAAGQVGVDDDHRGRLLGPPILSACDRMQHRQGLRPGAVARPRRNCDQTLVYRPNEAGRLRH